VIFIALATAMVLAAAACVAVPLWRGAARQTPGSAQIVAGVRDTQLAELERDVTNGVLSDADFQTSRRDLLNESESGLKVATYPPQPGDRRQRLFAASVALVLTAAVSLLYWQFGNWRVGMEGVEQASVPAVEEMVERLATRLHGSDANDLEGWEMLGHAYIVMERYPDALDAYSHARALSADSNADVLAGYAEAVTLANPDDFMDKALPLFEKTLRLDARNPQALWYGGLGALERGDKKLAVQRWQDLLAQNPPAQYRDIISKYIVEAGGTPSAAGPAGGSVAIKLHVSLSPALRAQASPDESLFIFARPPDQSAGPPLVARRMTAADLPADVTLTDQDRVMGGRSLADYAALTVTARLSRSGSPVAQSGDLVGQATWSKGAKVLELVISTPVK
jgi:cytochrome c-type biogenesis protein CcmH